MNYGGHLLNSKSLYSIKLGTIRQKKTGQKNVKINSGQTVQNQHTAKLGRLQCSLFMHTILVS